MKFVLISCVHFILHMICWVQTLSKLQHHVLQQARKKKKDTEFWYDVCGWVILGAGLFALAALAKGTPPLQPQSRF
jgi:uncharacterized membrane protein